MRFIKKIKLNIEKVFSKKTGFTVLELVVVMGIFGVLSSVALFNFTRFGSSISVQNLANNIALEIKKAQTNAVSGKNPFLFDASDRTRYGVYFNISKPSQFIYFADLDKSKNFTGNPSSASCGITFECQSLVSISTGDFISKVCLMDQNGSCNTVTNGELSIVFERPFPNAIITNNSTPESFYGATIEIKSPKDITKTITILQTGQISIGQ